MCLQKPQAANPTATADATLAAQITAAPLLYRQNQKYSPLYTQLGVQNMGTYANGLDSIYTNSILPTLTAANSTIKASNIADATTLAPAITAAERAGNPGAASLLDTMTSQAQQKLNLNGALDPFTQRMLQQNIREGQAARGMGNGATDAAAEAYYEDSTRNQRQQQALNNAQGVTSQSQSFYGNPLALLNGQGGDPGISAGNVIGASQTGTAPAQSGEFNPESQAGLQYGSQQFDSSVAGANNQNTWLTAPTSYAENA